MAEQGVSNKQLHRLKVIAVIIVVIAIVVAAWGIFSRVHTSHELETEAKQNEILSVQVVAPKHSDASDDLVLPGNVTAFSDAAIYARSNGYVKRWYADIGKHVKMGELLAEIETPEVDAQYLGSKADLDTAMANNKLSQSTAARYQSLQKTGLVAQQDVDNAQGDADAKKTQVAAAQQVMAALEQEKAFNRLTAPFDGVVTQRRIDVGSLVSAGNSSGQELFHISATDKLRIYVQVPQAYASLVKPGVQAQLNLIEQPDKKYTVTVTSTAQAIDPTTRTLLTELQADNPGGQLLPGSYSEVHFKLPMGMQSWRLPSNTLLFRGDGLHVATVDAQNKVVLNPIHMGRDFGSEIEILGGVSDGDQVILNPPDSLLAGTEVRIVHPKNAP